MRTAALIFPHQLFSDQPVLRYRPEKVLLIEDSLFFGDAQYPARFHKQKLAYHRATMTSYRARLETRKPELEYVRYERAESRLADVVGRLATEGFERLVVADPHDFMLRKRLDRAGEAHSIRLEYTDTPAFFNRADENRDWRANHKRWFMADFYQWQRTRFDILMDGDEPAGGQWSFDEDNRRKIPKREIDQIPAVTYAQREDYIQAAIESVETQFPDNPGSLAEWFYPASHDSASRWLDRFLEERFHRFGDYEDAMVQGRRWLYHGVLTPAINTGLLTPDEVIDRALEAAREYDVPLNSVEGFVRQIIGWREFMRATYEDLGVEMRTTNHWNHRRPLPESFYTGETGVLPVDDVIHRVLDTGYCHHIERLMVLGGFLFVCEIDPDDIYRWFMEMFIDSYDWVMVPNVYAMSQNADGGNITTKPYFSGSNYIRKMSNYPTGDWCDVWDGLFWRFIWTHREALGNNPRWAMMTSTVERMNASTRNGHLERAETFLDTL